LSTEYHDPGHCTAERAEGARVAASGGEDPEGAAAPVAAARSEAQPSGDHGAGRQQRRHAPFAALALALSACTSPPPAAPSPVAAPEPAATPTLWSAQPEHAPHPLLYLLGSVHVGDPRMRRLGGEVERIWERAEELVVEADVSRLDIAEIQLMMQRFGGIAAPERLQDRLAPETWLLLQAYLAEKGLPADAFDSVAPWLVATSVAVLQYRELGFEEELGVDRMFTERAMQERKPIVELETPEEQFALFANLPRDLQDLMLRDTLLRARESPDEANQMMEAWAHGDDALLEAIALEPLERAPEFEPFYERVFFERNERMAQRLAELALDGRVRLVVVGAGHMLGPRGIPALLEQRDFEIRKTTSR
jgi:uncharacterized protein YbaP (TraB family)